MLSLFLISISLSYLEVMFLVSFSESFDLLSDFTTSNIFCAWIDYSLSFRDDSYVNVSSFSSFDNREGSLGETGYTLLVTFKFELWLCLTTSVVKRIYLPDSQKLRAEVFFLIGYTIKSPLSIIGGCSFGLMHLVP
jgi:hypothetical protein